MCAKIGIMANDTVQQIKDKLSILDVVSPYVKLTKAGRLYRGLTPFGKEKSPSFYVNPERGSYYCFSTSQGGDHFSFIEVMEGLDFRGALKFLADKAGVQIVARAPGADVAGDRKDRLREMVQAAETFFKEQLTKDSAAYAYAIARGVTPETIEKFTMGFAPAGWRSLLEALEAKGYTAKELVAAGLIKEADGKPGTWYDRFRNRLMFPIRDASGRTVAFTGRALPAADGTIDPAKYLNSPETDLFKKSDVLFGMDLAKEAIRTRGFAILVEGQFDVVLLHQAGFTNTIALSGTALSTTHLSYIKRYAENLMLCLDADRAGLAASAKTARAALMNGMRVKAIRMPQGKDPADVVSEDPKVFTVLLQNAQSIIEFFLGVLSDLETDDLRRLRAVEGVVLPLVVSVRSPLERNRFVDIIARAISSTSEAVRQSLPRPEIQPHEAVDTQGNESRPQPTKPLSAQESRITLLLAAAALYPNTPLAERIKGEYNRVIDLLAGSKSAPARNEDPDERALFEAGIAFGETPGEHDADDLLRMFERTVLTEELRHATNMLRRAESNHSADDIRLYAESCKTISARLGQLH
jgi:DNA primase